MYDLGVLKSGSYHLLQTTNEYHPTFPIGLTNPHRSI